MEHFVTGQHTPIQHIPGLGFRHSFASMAVSLPPGMDYQPSSTLTNPVMTPSNSSFVSREDLNNCHWHDLPKFDCGPLESDVMVDHPKRQINQQSSKQPLHLSTLFLHQVGRKLTQYKEMLVNNSNKKKPFSNVASFASVTSAAKDPGPSISRQASTIRKNDIEGVTKGLLF